MVLLVELGMLTFDAFTPDGGPQGCVVLLIETAGLPNAAVMVGRIAVIMGNILGRMIA